MAAFTPGANGQLDISSIGYGEAGTNNTSHSIFIGSTYNESVIKLKAFVDSLTYDINKKVEEAHNPSQDHHNFASYNGSFGIQLGLNVPAANVTEARNNYAKITHLQNMILGATVGGVGDQLKHWQVVHMTNLINNGNLDAEIEPTNWRALSRRGLQCVITEIDYVPDFSVGFLKDSEGGLYPKNYNLKLTLNPDSERKIGGRKFLRSFNENGQYNNQDSCFFPFLAKVGKKDLESIMFNQLIGDQILYDLDKDNNKKLNNAKDTYVYLALPLEKNHTPISLENGTIALPHSLSDYAKIRRDLVFEAYIESFSRKFSNNIELESGDADDPLSQTNAGGTKNTMPPIWNIDMTLPAKNLEEAYINCGKIQYLMRMFLQRKKVSTATDTKTLESINVFVPSFIGKTNQKLSTLDECWANSYTLQFVNLSIEVDVSAGFFTGSGKYYPKAFKVKLELKDTVTTNYRLIKKDGSLADTDPPTKPVIDNNPTRTNKHVSNLKYWKAGT